MKRTVVLFLFIVLFAGTTRASDQWTSFLTNNSSTDYINAIITEGNTVWCATSGGVVKWDTQTGIHAIYTPDGESKAINAVAIDWNGVKWFGATKTVPNGGGYRACAYALKDSVWTSFTSENTDLFNKPNSWIEDITVDSMNKRMIFVMHWLSRADKQYQEYSYTLVSFDGGKWEELLSFPEGGKFPFIVVDTVNPWDLWGVGMGSYIYLYKKEAQGYTSNQIYFEASYARTNSITIDRNNNIWMGIDDHNGKGAVGVYDRTNITLLGSDVTGTIGRIQKVVIDRKGVKWFGSDGALVRYDDKTWSAYPFQRIDEYEHVIALAADESGDIWMGRGNSLSWAKGYGLWRFHPAQSTVEDAALPQAVKINGNSPNPFNPSTTISFTLPQSGKVELAVYSITGQRVRTLVSGAFSEGAYSVAWDGRDDSGKAVSSGLYLSRLTTGKQTATGKMVLMR